MQSRKPRRARGEFVSIQPQFTGSRRMVFRFADGREAAVRQTRRAFVWDDDRPPPAGQDAGLPGEPGVGDFIAWLDRLYRR